MNWGLCTIAFREMDVCDVIRTAAQLGFDEVEIIGRHIDGKSGLELDDIRETARAAGIGISGVAPYLWLTQNKELLQESMGIADRFSAMACRLGARMIRTFTDAGPTGIGSDMATEEHWKIAVESLKTITAMAPEIIYAVETHHWTLADTPATCERLLREVDRPNLKLIYQPFIRGGHITDDFLRLQAHVVHTHLNPTIAPNPKGGLAACGIDYASLIRCLAENGYPHTCAIEFCGPADADWNDLRDTLAWCRQEAGAHLRPCT